MTLNLRPLPEKCVVCHAEADRPFAHQHITDFGENCLGCHDGLDSMSEFVHDSITFHSPGSMVPPYVRGLPRADYRLGSGKQAEALPLTEEAFRSHAGGVAQPVMLSPQLHLGMFPSGCVKCHDQDGWSPSLPGRKTIQACDDTHFSRQACPGLPGKPLVCQELSCRRGEINF